MISKSRGSDQRDGLHYLNQPRPIQVQTNPRGSRPLSIGLHRGKARRPVSRIEDEWVVADEWWRNEIDRRYYRLVLEDGLSLTIFHDRVANVWYAQAY